MTNTIGQKGSVGGAACLGNIDPTCDGWFDTPHTADVAPDWPNLGMRGGVICIHPSSDRSPDCPNEQKAELHAYVHAMFEYNGLHMCISLRGF